MKNISISTTFDQFYDILCTNHVYRWTDNRNRTTRNDIQYTTQENWRV